MSMVVMTKIGDEIFVLLDDMKIAKRGNGGGTPPGRMGRRAGRPRCVEGSLRLSLSPRPLGSQYWE